MVEIKGRYIKVILYLLEQKYTVSAFRISNDIGFNINTLRKDIPQLGNLLRENGISLIAKPKVGFKIDGPPEKMEELKNKLNVLSNNLLDRKGKIWYTAEIFLSKEKIPTIEDLCELLNISRPTAVDYIHEVKEWLSKQEIMLYGKAGSGYQIEADEENIRDAIIGSIKNFLGFEFQIVASEFAKGVLKHNLLEIFRDANFEEIKNFIDEIQTQIQARFTDEDTLTIALAIAIAIRRIRNNHLISFDSRIIKEVLSNKLTRSLKNSINKLEDKFQLRFTESEISYLSLKFIGAKTQNIEGTKAPIVMLKFKKAADEIVQLTDELMGLPINKESEFISMLAHHLESTITKIKMGIKIENPSLEMVKREYPIAYAVAEKASKIIKERFHLEIPNEEKGYIAMYIAVSLEELRKPTKRKVVVICPMGIATSKLLYHKLANEIPEIEIVKVGSIKEFEEERFAKKIDLIISTVPLLGVKIPYVVVSPFLRTEDKKLIKEILKIEKGVFTGDIIGEDIFDERLFFPQISVNSSRQVINLLSNALIKNGFARDGLAKTVIAREKKFPTGINTEIPIAIPHAGPEFTIKKGFAIATLKNPIKFREMGNPQKSLDVRIVIMPVLTGKEEDGKEFYEVIQKLKDKQLLEKVMQSMSHPEIRKMLNTV